MAITVFGFTDIHWSDRDEQALECAELAHRLLKPDITVLGGDLLMCPGFSTYPRSHIEEAQAADWEQSELIPAAAFIDRVGKRTKRKMYVLEGNHEARVEKWAANASVVGQSVYNMLSPQRRLLQGQDKKRVVWVPYSEKPDLKSYLSLTPNLSVVHGWSYCIHAAAMHLAKSKTRSIIFNHTHRMQRVVSREPWEGRSLESMSAGCLCHLHPIYKADGNPTEWVHGFWIAYISEADPMDFTLYQVIINFGRCILPSGKEVKI